MNHERNIRKKPLASLLRSIPLFLIGTSLGLKLAYSNHHKLVELNNLGNYKITEESCEFPYNVHILRETRGDTVFTYLINTRTDHKLPINKNMKVGNLKYRLEGLIGNKEDIESIIGKTELVKDKTKNTLKGFYFSIKNFITKYTTKENEHK